MVEATENMCTAPTANEGHALQLQAQQHVLAEQGTKIMACHVAATVPDGAEAPASQFTTAASQAVKQETDDWKGPHASRGNRRATATAVDSSQGS